MIYECDMLSSKIWALKLFNDEFSIKQREETRIHTLMEKYTN